MSEIAALAFSSCLSGTRDPTILPNRLLSFIKKKLMNTTENIPTPMLEINDAAEPSTDENIETSKNFFSSLNKVVSSL